MQYEVWFGPNAMNLNHSAAQPVNAKGARLTSATMVKAGLKGYDSADPAIIQLHATQIQEMGADAVQVDLSNGAGCTFAISSTDIQKFCSNNQSRYKLFQAIKSNLANLFQSYNSMGIPLKIIPLINGADSDLFSIESNGKTVFENSLLFLKDLAARYPNQWVIYQGHPLVTIFTTVPTNINMMAQQQQFLQNSGYLNQFTVRFVGGFTESQPALWSSANGPQGLHQMKNPIWSWVDRLRPDLGLIPSYFQVNGQAENFTVTSASISDNQSHGWGLAPTGPYEPGDGLRNINPAGSAAPNYTFNTFMSYANQVQPTFLFIDQFNEFGQASQAGKACGQGYDLCDQGWDANTTNDLEPADLWGSGPLTAVAQAISRYKYPLGFFSIAGQPGIYFSNGTTNFCGVPSMAFFTLHGGSPDLSNVRIVHSSPKQMILDGDCSTVGYLFAPPEFFRVNSGSGIYHSNGTGGVCVYNEWNHFVMDGGSNQSAVTNLPRLPSTTDVGGIPVCDLSPGFFWLGYGAIYQALPNDRYCVFSSWNSYIQAGGAASLSNVNNLTKVPPIMKDVGVCQ